MGKKRRSAYTEDQKAEAVAYYVGGHSAAETAKKFGCSVGSVASWTKQAGQSKSEELRAQTADAVQARRELARQRRAELEVKLLERTHELLDLQGELVERARSTDAEKALSPKEACQAASNCSYAASLNMKELRLEAGEPTGREEVRHDYSDRSDEDLIREAEQILRDAARRQSD